MSNLDIIRGRHNVMPWKNLSTGTRSEGDVVIITSTSGGGFATTITTGWASGFVGVVQESIAAAASGRVLTDGYAAKVNVNAATTVGNFLYTSTAPGKAAPSATRAKGAFAQAVSKTTAAAGGTIEAKVWGVTQPAAAADILTTKGDLLGFSTVPARLALGTANQVLTVSTSQAMGLKWEAGSRATLTTKGDLLIRDSTDILRLPVGTTGQVLTVDASTGNGIRWASQYGGFEFYIDGALSAENDAMFCKVPANTKWIIESVYCDLVTTSSGGDVVIDLNRNTSSIFATTGGQPKVVAGQTTSAAFTPDNTTLSGGQKLKLDICNVGSTANPGTNLLVTVNVRRV